MHNWLEGVLQHHLCTLWGIGRDAGTTKKAKEIDLEERFTDADVADSEDELTELYNEALNYDDPMSGSHHSQAPTSPSPSLTSLDTMTNSDVHSTTPTVMDSHISYYGYRDDLDDDSDDEDYLPPPDNSEDIFNFSSTQLQSIRD
ncbi:hypothetical protein DXG01_016186, partial [Tephrocybe rancida]